MEVTRQATAYTNHTLLPEALEAWSIDLFGTLLPRHLEIIFEINRRLLDDVRHRYPGDEGRIARMSLIDENGCRYVRMANLACAGSHAINGVAALHTELLKAQVLPDWVEMYPERFVNVTNGVTPRRFMVVSNPGLSGLITGKIGDAWPTHPRRALRGLEAWPPATASSSNAGARSEDREQAASRQGHQGPHRDRGRSPFDVRRPRQAYPRVQAAAPERPAHPDPLSPPEG